MSVSPGQRFGTQRRAGPLQRPAPAGRPGRERAMPEGRHRSWLPPAHPWQLARIEVVCALLRENVPALAAPGTGVLDVGCGDGTITAALAGRYPRSRFAGVDPALSPAEAARLTRQFGLPNLSFHPALAGARVEADSVGLVLILDVLEHMAEERAFLSDIVHDRSVASGAAVLLTVPAVRCLFGAHDRLIGHYRRYDLAGLRRLAAAAGLEVKSDGYFFATLVPVRAMSLACRRIWPRPLPQVQRTAAWSAAWPLRGLLRALLFADFFWCRMAGLAGLSIPGLSCYAVCRKPAS